jgi:hypothetical protein
MELYLPIRQHMQPTKHHLTILLQLHLPISKRQHVLLLHHRLSVNQPTIYYLSSLSSTVLAT